MRTATSARLVSSLLKWITCIVLAWSLCGYSRAELLVYDGFVAGDNLSEGEYTATAGGGDKYDLNPDQNPLIEGFEGSWTTRYFHLAWGIDGPEGGSLVFPGVTGTGSKVRRLSEIEYSPAFRRFDRSSARLKDYVTADGKLLGREGTVLYVSFLIRAAPGQGIGLALWNGSAREFEPSSGYGDSVGLQILDAEGETIFRFRRGNNGEHLEMSGNNDVNLVVFRMEFFADGKGSVIYFLNPTDLTEEENNIPVAATDSRPIGFDSLYLDAVAEKGFDDSFIDEFRLTNSWDASLFQATGSQ